MKANREAELLCRYLVSQSLTRDAALLYARATELHPVHFSPAEERIWSQCMKHPSLIPFVDAALALKKNQGGIRRKVFLMFAVVESLPEYSGSFLPVSRKPPYVIRLFLRGVAAVLKSITGQLLLWIL
jgi:hypothetical protein